MENQHRTLQQGFTRLCVAWLKRLAEPDYHYDDRNKASVRLARSKRMSVIRLRSYYYDDMTETRSEQGSSSSPERR